MYSFSRNSIKNRQGVDERLIAISDLAISSTVVDFGHPLYGGLRTEAQQYQLYLEERSERDGKIRVSNHQLGKALDFYAYVNGRASWEEYHLAMVAAAFLQSASILGHKIRWGGLWGGPLYQVNGKHITGKFRDYPHIELLE